MRAWAAYWALIHRDVKDMADRTSAVHLLSYDDLCARPREYIARMLDHCELPAEHAILDFADILRAPSYYRPDFSKAELEAIMQETGDIAGRLGLATEPAA